MGEMTGVMEVTEARGEVGEVGEVGETAEMEAVAEIEVMLRVEEKSRDAHLQDSVVPTEHPSLELMFGMFSKVDCLVLKTNGAIRRISFHTPTLSI